MVVRLATENKVNKANPFEKRDSSKKRKSFRNKGPLAKDKKRRYQLLDWNEAEAGDEDDIHASGHLSSKVGFHQSTGSEIAQETYHRTKKEVMAEVIAKSKQFKSERKEEKQLFETLIEDIDQEFMRVLPTLPRRNLDKETIKTARRSLKLSETNRTETRTTNERLEFPYLGSTRPESSSSDPVHDTNRSLSKMNSTHTKSCDKDIDGMPSSLALRSECRKGRFMSDSDLSTEKDTTQSEDRSIPTTCVPETYAEFQNRLLRNDIIQEQYLDTLVNEVIERHDETSAVGNTERLLTFMFHALEMVASGDMRPGDLTRTLETTKILLQKIRLLLSNENNLELGDFVERVTTQLSEPLYVTKTGREETQSFFMGTGWVIDLSCKLDCQLFLLLFSVSRLSSLKNTISPAIKNLIFLIGQWLTRMEVSCLHQIRKGLGLIQLFLPHLEASECFVPELLTYCFSIIGLFTKENSVLRESFSLFNFSQSVSLQHMIRQTIEDESKEVWAEEKGSMDSFLGVFACNSVSCKSQEDWRETSYTLCDILVTCRDIISRICTILKPFDAFYGLCLPLMLFLYEISEDQKIWPALRSYSVSFASSLKEMIQVTEERGLKPLQLYYKKSSLPIEYKPKLKDDSHQQYSRRLKQCVRREKKRTMKWLNLETSRQQQEMFSQRESEDLYRTKRTQEATSFLQQQQQNWNKQEKKWKNMNKSSL
ncbi:hypothetical protein GpartN1_g3953.t1 [Galdieria partita]|uniref:Uncharacterized protein n=1 Tax=Galdieria partita TaxID=83374 RepID=A0A9C7PZ44_9RHOD|nr:hypothetical protein GpartN1_g3953.t1 [Galdieria partita]